MNFCTANARSIWNGHSLFKKLFVAMLRLVSMDGQGNWVRIPDGTAAVYVESILVDENQSLGKPEKAEDGCGSKCSIITSKT